MTKKVFILSLGCPKNLTDAEVMAGQLSAAGYELTNLEAQADIALLNTCAFLTSAVKESETEIKRLCALKKKGKLSKIAVTGCLVERQKELILKRYPQIDAVVGIHALDKIHEALTGSEHYILPPQQPLNAPTLKARLTATHSAYLKVADGCDNRCAYCAIPSIRGGFRSKPLEQVVQEAKDLVNSGAVEISLIAQDTTSYGLDLYGKPELHKLARQILKLKGLKWLRLMYAYPERLSEDTLKLMRDEEKLCHYLDMPLQHIADPVLKAMNRRSTEKSIREKINLARKIVPDLALRTNFIVGFPGETEADFKRLIDFVTETAFDNVGVFPYSREPGTPAARLAKQLTQKIKISRVRKLINAQSRVVDRINEQLIGKKIKILMDSPDYGRTYRDAPEIDGKVAIINTLQTGHSGKILKAGDFAEVKITEARGYLRRGIYKNTKN